MPHLLGETLVVTKNELIPYFWSSYNSLKQDLWRHKETPYGIKRARYGGNGRELLVDYDTLPNRVKEAIPDPRKPEHPLDPFYDIDHEAVKFYNDYTYPDGSYLKPETIGKLIINASVLKAAISLEESRIAQRIAKRGSLRDVLKSIHSDVTKFKEHLPTPHSLNTNYRKFKNQINQFKKQGFKSLIRDADGNSKQNAIKIDKATSSLLKQIHAGQEHKPTSTTVYETYKGFLSGEVVLINNSTGEQYDPAGFKELSESAVSRFLRKYEVKIGTHAKRSGDRQKLMQKFIPYSSLEQPALAGSMISIDDRQPPFWYDKGKRMWWYLGIDLASEAIVAWAYGKTKEELITNFYRQMVRNHAKWGVELPFSLECESSLNSSFKGTFLKNGSMFNDVQIHANSARSKRIERHFGDMRYIIEKPQPGWIARPHADSESNQAGPKDKVIIPYEKLVEQCFKNIITWNNMPCNQDKSMGRFDYFMKNQNPDLTPTNWRGFMQHLGYKQESSCRAGIMALQNREWLLGDNGEIYTGESLITLLKMVEGKEIDLYWLDDDQGNVLKALVYMDGRYICEALPKPVAARAPIEAKDHHRQAAEVMARYTSTVTSFMQTQKNEIDKITVVDNRKITVSDSFSIEGITNYTPPSQYAEVLEDMPEIEEHEYVPDNHGSGGSWKDAFR